MQYAFFNNMYSKFGPSTYQRYQHQGFENEQQLN